MILNGLKENITGNLANEAKARAEAEAAKLREEAEAQLQAREAELREKAEEAADRGGGGGPGSPERDC